MKNIIKFRAWDMSNKRMGSHDALLDPNQVNPAVLTDCLIADGTGYDTDTILMRFIGLKDKYGEEIYEGDYVQYNTGERWLVCWSQRQAGFIYKSTKKGYGADQLPNMHEVRIVGNKYENRLVNGSKTV